MRWFILSFILLTSNYAWADAFDYAFQLYQKEMFTEAQNEYANMAKEGDPRGAFMLGLMHENGRGGPKDYTKAAQFYTEAANKGAAYAMANLGVLYHYGQGAPLNIGKARELYGKSAEKGNPRGQLLFAYTYLEGQGTEQDLKKASQWFKRAANQGEKLAFIEMARLEENPKEAYFWAKMADKNGDKEEAAPLIAKYSKALNDKDIKEIDKKLGSATSKPEKPDAILPMYSPVANLKTDNYRLMNGTISCLYPPEFVDKHPCLRIGGIRIGQHVDTVKAEASQTIRQGNIRLNVYFFPTEKEGGKPPYLVVGDVDNKIVSLQITGSPIRNDVQIDFSGLKLGDSSRKILETVGLPLNKAAASVPNSELWNYSLHGFSFEITQDKITSIRIAKINENKEEKKN